MGGLGVDNTKLNRIILTRCDRDLACILKKYKETYGKEFLDKLKVCKLEQSDKKTYHRFLPNSHRWLTLSCKTIIQNVVPLAQKGVEL